MAIETHDFKKPVRLQSDIEERLLDWMKGTCMTLCETCERFIPFEIEASVTSAETARWSGFFPTLDETAIGWRVALGRDDRDTLLIMRRPLALLLVGGLLGDKLTTLPDAETLTPAADKVIKFFIDYFVRAVRENWPGGEPGTIHLRQDEPSLKRQKTLQAEESIVICSFKFTGAFGEESWYWLVPYEVFLGLFDSIEYLDQSTQSETERQLVARLVEDMRAELTVRLGTVQLNAREVQSLRPGDVLILDQRLEEPLVANIASEPAFLGWPGRVGRRQAIQIESLAKD